MSGKGRKHLYFDNINHLMSCSRCGGYKPVEWGQGVRLDKAMATMRGFINIHKNCTEDKCQEPK